MLSSPQELEIKINQFINTTRTSDRRAARELIDHFGGDVELAIEAQITGNLPEIHTARHHDAAEPQAAGIDMPADVEARPSVFTSLFREISRVLTGGQQNLTPEESARRFVSSLETDNEGNYPDFFIGGYKDSLAAALASSRLLIIYLHCHINDSSRQFASSVLSSPDLIRLLNSNFVTWGGDVSLNYEAYKLSHHLQLAAFPFLAIISPLSSREGKLLVRIEPADFNAIQISSVLIHASANHRPIMPVQRGLMAQQDDEFESSLLVDQAKRRLALEEEEKEVNDARDLERLKQSFTVEPTANVTTIRIQFSDGKKIVRKFEVSDKVSRIRDFVKLQLLDSGIASFDLVMSYPKRELTDYELSLDAAGLCPQAVIMVKNNDA